jgi:hypothetical protein
MARETTTNQQISGTFTAHNGLTRFSMAGWMYRSAPGTRQHWGTDGVIGDWTAIQHWSDNNVYFLLGNPTASYGGSSQNITGWNHFCFTFDGSQIGNSNRLNGYVNGLKVSLSFNGLIPSSISSSVNNQTLRIGRIQSVNNWSIGAFAELSMWNDVITEEQILSLSKGFTAIKIAPQSLIFYAPLVRDIQDVRLGTVLSNTDTTISDHPRIYT